MALVALALVVFGAYDSYPKKKKGLRPIIFFLSQIRRGMIRYLKNQKKIKIIF